MIWSRASHATYCRLVFVLLFSASRGASHDEHSLSVGESAKRHEASSTAVRKEEGSAKSRPRRAALVIDHQGRTLPEGSSQGKVEQREREAMLIEDEQQEAHRSARKKDIRNEKASMSEERRAAEATVTATPAAEDQGPVGMTWQQMPMGQKAFLACVFTIAASSVACGIVMCCIAVWRFEANCSRSDRTDRTE
eukprot:TRINITY_DN77127_c0_g1_i1.p2 TRINITY_DN77127_c0_g1~~TRINITY_DN77127_c0_g1_i1.p2  ORF type:complete len:221 (+),score=46.17 TRINITY_DN77127_c0_g1_i1:83-664(+)